MDERVEEELKNELGSDYSLVCSMLDELDKDDKGAKERIRKILEGKR